MPNYIVRPGDTFQAYVYANAGFAASVFQLSFTTSDPLEILDITLDPTKWTGPVLKRSPQSAAINAVLADTESVPSGPQSGRELLAVVTVRVPSSSGAIVGLFSCTIVDFGSVQETSINPGGRAVPTPAGIVDRFFRGTPSLEGRIIVQPDTVRTLMPTVAKADIINTAVLSGQDLETSVNVVGLYTSGRLRTLTKSLQCASSDVKVVQVAADCSRMFFDGSETAGSPVASITVTGKGLGEDGANVSASAGLRVWAPKTPIDLTLYNNRLLPVANWQFYHLASDSCLPAYQRTSYTAFAEFSNDGVNYIRARVTSIVRPALRSADPFIATLDETGVIRGNHTGDTEIQV